jgi:hypothetical protein
MFLLPDGSKQSLIDAVNAVNTFPVDFSAGDLYFGKVRQEANGHVSVPAVTLHSSQFEGYIRLNYKRLDLGKAYGTVKPKIRRVGYPTLYRLLPIINETLGLSLTEADVTDISITWLNDNEQINIPVIAKANSLGFEGQFMLEYTRVRPELASLAFKTLDVLKHPVDPTLGKKSIAMMTWGMDFSAEMVDDFTINVGIWWHHDKVAARMAELGFPDWPQVPYFTLNVLPTSKVPSANQEFEYVVIQPDIDLPDFVGDAYIHFNR